MNDFREMKSIDPNDPIFDNCAVVECSFETEEPWDPDYSNVCIDVDLNKKPLYKYLYYRAVYEGAVIPVFYSEYPQKDSFAFLKAINKPSRSHWSAAIRFCVFALLFCLAVGVYVFFFQS